MLQAISVNPHTVIEPQSSEVQDKKHPAKSSTNYPRLAVYSQSGSPDTVLVSDCAYNNRFQDV